MFNKIGCLIERVAFSTGIVASIGAFLMMVHISLEVLLRNVAQTQLPATVEVVSYFYMVSIAFLPIAWVEAKGHMISVSVFDAFLGPKSLRVSDFIVCLVSAFVYVILIYTSLGAAIESYERQTYLSVLDYRLPIWPSYWLAPIGLSLVMLVVIYRGANIIKTIFRGGAK